MKQFLLAAAIGAASIGISNPANAQFGYNFSTSVQPYTALANATSANNGAIWVDTSNYVLPIGFPFKLGNITMNNLRLTDCNFITDTSTSLINGIALIGAALQDRNVGKTTSASPIRYTTTGAAGSRIFKLEVANAGFTDEAQYNTDNDYLNYQVWLYESNHAYEIRFGASNISHFSDYFGTRMLTGFMKNLDMSTGNFDKLYVLNGNAANPTIDSLPPFSLIKGLIDVPVNGTVYRFVPKNATTGVGQVAKVSLGKVYPTRSLGELVVESDKADHYDIISANGSVVKRGFIHSGKETIYLNELVAGNYLIRLSNDKNESDVQKFVIVN